MKYWRMRPIQTTGAEIPIRTKTIEALSKSERGRKRREDPDRQRDRHPEDDAAEDEGSRDRSGACRMTVLTSWRLVNDRPSEWWITRRFMNIAYWTGTGLSRPRKCRARATVSGVARCPTASRAGSAGMMKKMT